MLHPIFLRSLIGLIIMLSASCQKSELKTATHSLHLNFQEGDIPSCHPFHGGGHIRGRVLGKLLHEGLTRMDSTGEPALAGAKALEISPDKMQYTFLLRDNYWSNGEKVTADQYAFAWRHALAPGSDCPRADLFYCIRNGKKAKKGECSIDEIGVYAKDPNTLVVELEYPSPYLLSLLAQPMFAPLKEPQGEPTIFNGPFKIKNWVKGVSIQLEANNHFWNHGHVQLHEIVIDCVQDPMTALYMYEKGQIDWIGEPFCPLQKESALELMRKKLALCQPVNRFFWVYLNTNHPLLKAEKLRKALSLSLERTQIVNHICIKGTPILTPVHDAMIPHPYFDIQEDFGLAKSLLSEALQENGQTEPPVFVLNYVADLAGHKQLAEYLKERWENTLGLTIKLHGCEWNVLRSNLEHHTFEMGACLASAIYDDPLEFLDRFEELDNGNFSQWESSAFKEKIAEVRHEIDAQKRMDLLAEAEKILVDQTPLIPIYRCIHVYTHNPALKDYVLDGAGCVDFAYSRMSSQ